MKRSKCAKRGYSKSQDFYEVYAADATDDIPTLYQRSMGGHCYDEVDSAKVIQLVTLYLRRKYKEAFACLKKNFSFLFENENENEKKQPICTEWYHDTIRKVIKIVADRPYDEKYIFVKI